MIDIAMFDPLSGCGLVLLAPARRLALPVLFAEKPTDNVITAVLGTTFDSLG